MKLLHWILFALAAWIIIVPFIADDIIVLILGETAAEIDLVQLLKWDDLFLGLAISIVALVVVTLEQASQKTAGLSAMHWMQVVLGIWIALAPFGLDFTFEGFTWSHFVTGGFTAIFALIQINEETSNKKKRR